MNVTLQLKGGKKNVHVKRHPADWRKEGVYIYWGRDVQQVKRLKKTKKGPRGESLGKTTSVPRTAGRRKATTSSRRTYELSRTHRTKKNKIKRVQEGEGGGCTNEARNNTRREKGVEFPSKKKKEEEGKEKKRKYPHLVVWGKMGARGGRILPKLEPTVCCEKKKNERKRKEKSLARSCERGGGEGGRHPSLEINLPVEKGPVRGKSYSVASILFF